MKIWTDEEQTLETLKDLRTQLAGGNVADRLGWMILWNATLYLKHGEAYRKHTLTPHASWIV